MATFVPFYNAVNNPNIDFDSDSFKVALANTAPDASTDTQLSDITQISAGNGYTTGGNAVSTVSTATTGGVWRLFVSDVNFTASGGSMGTFQYAVLYDDTSTGDLLIGYIDYGIGLSLGSGNTFTVDADDSLGLWTITL